MQALVKTVRLLTGEGGDSAVVRMLVLMLTPDFALRLEGV